MARLARIVIPHLPHHITQRGNRRQTVFFCDQDYRTYLELLTEYCQEAGTQIWAYCLMPNHVHLVLVPSDEKGLHGALKEPHRFYTRHVNFREGWRGYLWQGRFSSFPMDEAYLYQCVRYVELNPVRAGLVDRPEAWRWSSARAHISGDADGVVDVKPMQDRVGNWQDYLRVDPEEEFLRKVRSLGKTGRPLGDDGFLRRLERETGRQLLKKRPGPRKRDGIPGH